MVTPIRKYTDLDVRRNPDFYGLVIDYLMEYNGDFEFLVSCKTRIEQGVDLSIGMVRGVLNCMWVDPKVTGMPEPLPEEFDADVIPLPERGQSYRRQPKAHKRVCERTDVHEHKHSDFATMHYCPGIPLVDRKAYSYRLPATIRPGYLFVKAKSPTTFLIHRACSAEVEWLSLIHI